MISIFKNTNLINKIIKIVFYITMIVGISFTLIYIFYTSTALLTSDSVITDVLAHQQVLNKEIILSHWYYGNELWLFSLSIPTLILSFFIKNNIILRQISVLITAIIFFIILYKYGRKFIGKREAPLLIIIFLTGISYSVLDYFYAFNAYLTVVINSMLLLYFYYKSMEESKSKKIYYILSLVFTFLFNMGSLRYFPSVTVPFLITELLLLIINNKNNSLKKTIKKEQKTIKMLSVIVIVSCLALSTFIIITHIYHYEQRAGATAATTLSGEVVSRDLSAVINCINNFFGYDNADHPLIVLTGNQYFVNNHREYPIVSFFTFTNIIKIIACIVFILITPIVLYKNYRKNDKKINFLLVFNTSSWALMIYMYIFTCRFFYNSSELKYFIFNIVLSIILGLYFLYKYVATNNTKKYIIDIFIILYVVSNLYTTALIIRDHNSEVMDKKFELVELLKENNLTFGYGGFWNGLLTNYLSNYEITVASLNFISDTSVKPYKWYSDERWYSQIHTGRVFLILDEIDSGYFNYYKDKYPKPDKVLNCTGFIVYVYNENPFLDDI